MCKLLLVRDGKDEEIATCEFSGDGKVLFDYYKKQDRHHVKLVYYGIFSTPQATEEFIPTA